VSVLRFRRLAIESFVRPWDASRKNIDLARVSSFSSGLARPWDMRTKMPAHAGSIVALPGPNALHGRTDVITRGVIEKNSRVLPALDHGSSRQSSETRSTRHSVRGGLGISLMRLKHVFAARRRVHEQTSGPFGAGDLKLPLER